MIELEDVSRADAASQVVTRMRFPATKIHQPGLILFDLAVPKDAIDEKSLYSIRAHVDINGSGEVERGDYITTQSYPVLTRGYGDKVRLQLQRV